MRFPCRIDRNPDGRWRAVSSGSPLGTIEVTAADRDEAVDKLRREIRYRWEICPCSGVADDFVELVWE